MPGKGLEFACEKPKETSGRVPTTDFGFDRSQQGNAGIPRRISALDNNVDSVTGGVSATVGCTDLTLSLS